MIHYLLSFQLCCAIVHVMKGFFDVTPVILSILILRLFLSKHNQEEIVL